MSPLTNWKGGKGQNDQSPSPLREDSTGASEYYADIAAAAAAAQVSVGSFSDADVDAAQAEASLADV